MPRSTGWVSAAWHYTPTKPGDEIAERHLLQAICQKCPASLVIASRNHHLGRKSWRNAEAQARTEQFSAAMS